MSIGVFEIIGILIIWSIIGMLIWIVITNCFNGRPLSYTNGLEFLNPIWIYKNYKVNFFGVFIIFLVYNLVSPIGSLCYWFYKLCTVRR